MESLKDVKIRLCLENYILIPLYLILKRYTIIFLLIASKANEQSDLKFLYILKFNYNIVKNLTKNRSDFKYDFETFDCTRDSERFR